MSNVILRKSKEFYFPCCKKQILEGFYIRIEDSQILMCLGFLRHDYFIALKRVGDSGDTQQVILFLLVRLDYARWLTFISFFSLIEWNG